jgi:hypothetical protein
MTKLGAGDCRRRCARETPATLRTSVSILSIPQPESQSEHKVSRPFFSTHGRIPHGSSCLAMPSGNAGTPTPYRTHQTIFLDVCRRCPNDTVRTENRNPRTRVWDDLRSPGACDASKMPATCSCYNAAKSSLKGSGVAREHAENSTANKPCPCRRRASENATQGAATVSGNLDRADAGDSIPARSNRTAGTH